MHWTMCLISGLEIYTRKKEKSEELSQILHSLFNWEDFEKRKYKYVYNIENNYQNC